MDDSAEIVRATRESIARCVAELESNGVRDEALAAVRPARRLLGFETSASLRPVGRAWRLGVLLLDRSGRLYSTGEVTRAVEPGRAAVNRSAAGEQRRAWRRAAARGPFPVGDVVNFGFTPLSLDHEALEAPSSALVLKGSSIRVRWAGATVPLEEYLADHVALARSISPSHPTGQKRNTSEA